MSCRIGLPPVTLQRTEPLTAARAPTDCWKTLGAPEDSPPGHALPLADVPQPALRGLHVQQRLRLAAPEQHLAPQPLDFRRDDPIGLVGLQPRPRRDAGGRTKLGLEPARF